MIGNVQESHLNQDGKVCVCSLGDEQDECSETLSFPLLLALWIMAAKSELEDRNSSESARHLFLRALRFHPDNKKVYQEVKYAIYYIFTKMQRLAFFHACSSKTLQPLCISTSVWSCCIVRN